jgi:hypothetical protein
MRGLFDLIRDSVKRNGTFRRIFLLFVFFSVMLVSCSKDPGEGGTSSISGKVFAKDYNSTFTVLQSEFYVSDIWVYIIYGNDKDYGDRIKTSYDGTYEFKYLRPGTYHIYAYSKDSTMQTNAAVAVIRDVDIQKNYRAVEAPLIQIFTVNGKN